MPQAKSSPSWAYFSPTVCVPLDLILYILTDRYATVISKLGKKLGLRQRVIATATVFFRRFYLKNSYCDTDPFLLVATCCYVAAKAEETPVHVKNIVTEARALFNSEC